MATKRQAENLEMLREALNEAAQGLEVRQLTEAEKEMVREQLQSGTEEIRKVGEKRGYKRHRKLFQ